LIDFVSSDLENQRRLLNSGKLRDLVDILIIIVCRFESANQTLACFLPYIEGILIDTPESVDDLIELSEESGKNIIKCLNRIIHMTDSIYSSFIQDMAVRILTRVYSR